MNISSFRDELLYSHPQLFKAKLSHPLSFTWPFKLKSFEKEIKTTATLRKNHKMDRLPSLVPIATT